MEEKACYLCEFYNSENPFQEECNYNNCYLFYDRPFFKLHHRYKSKLMCKDKVYYNIHHFNRFQKWLAKIIWKIKIEDVRRI